MNYTNVHRGIETGLNIFYGMQPQIVKHLSSSSKTVRLAAVDIVSNYIVQNASVPVMYVCIMILRRMIMCFGKDKRPDFDTQYDRAMRKIETRFEKMIKHKRTSDTISAYSTLIDSFYGVLEQLCEVFDIDPAKVLEDEDDNEDESSVGSRSSRRRSSSNSDSSSSDGGSVSTSFEFSEEE
jgi:hypothetical protein